MPSNITDEFLSILQKRYKESTKILQEKKNKFRDRSSEEDLSEIKVDLEEFSDEMKNDTIWTTKKLEKLKFFRSKGLDLNFMNGGIPNPYIAGNNNQRRPDLRFGYTTHEIEEIKKCKEDIIYFANHYCYVMTPEGYQPLKLRDYQIRILKEFVNNRFVVFCASRQIGKTTMSCIFLLWFAIFNKEKNMLILSNKSGTMTEIIDKIREIYEHLPYFLKPGVSKNGATFFSFENKCRIFGQATTKTPGIGFTIHLLYIDEFAHIPENIIEPFYENVFPVLSASKDSARLIITSTPNGTNLFYNIYSNAERGENTFKALKVDWWEVPGRDEEWKKREISNSSPEAFERQYGNRFFEIGKSYLDEKTCDKLEKNSVNYQKVNLQDKIFRNSFFLKPGIELEDLKKMYCFISIDYSEGIGKDYTVGQIFRLNFYDYKDPKNDNLIKNFTKVEHFFRLEQIGKIYSNEINPIEFSEEFYNFYRIYLRLFTPILMEINDNRYLPTYIKFQEADLDKSFIRVKRNTRFTNGVRLDSKNKSELFLHFKTELEKGRYEITDKQTYIELKSFQYSPKGLYVATEDHDDCALSCINSSLFFDSFNQIVFYIEDFLDEHEEDEKNILEIIDKNFKNFENEEPKG